MKLRIFPDSVLSAFHDGEGWLIKAERHGEAPYYFGAYAIDARTAHWTAGEVARGYGLHGRAFPAELMAVRSAKSGARAFFNTRRFTPAGC